MKEFLKKLKQKKLEEQGLDPNSGNDTPTTEPGNSDSPNPIVPDLVVQEEKPTEEPIEDPKPEPVQPENTVVTNDVTEPSPDVPQEPVPQEPIVEVPTEKVLEPEPISDPIATEPVQETPISEEPKNDTPVEPVIEETKKEEDKQVVVHDYKKYPLLENFEELYPEKIETFTYCEEPEDCVIWEDEKDGKKSIKESTLGKLVELLTSGTYYDIHMQNTFMLTFRSFTDQETLFAKLVERFNLPPPPNATREELAKFKVEKLDKTRLRISSTIKYWIENFYHFDFIDIKMREKVYEVIKMMEACRGGKIYSQVITRALAKANEEQNGTIQTKMEYPPTLFPAISIVKRTSFFSTKDKSAQEIKPKNKILAWPAMEIARQLCLIDYANFLKIEPKECLNQAWAKGQRETKAPGICAMVNQFNLCSMWIGSVVVQATDIQERIVVIQKFIEVAQKLWELNNLNGVFTVTSGLALASVFRLKKTWPQISEESRKEYETLQAAISSKNFAAIRSRIKNVKPPAIPYIGIYLTDLTFIEDGNPKYINGKINFVKCKCFAGVIRDLQTYQNTKYQFAVAKELYDQLTSITAMTEDEMFKMSLEIEPKEPKKSTGTTTSPKTPTPTKK